MSGVSTAGRSPVALGQGRGPDGRMRPLFPERGLYALIDTVTLARAGLDPLAFAGAVLEGGAAALQLRAKDLAAREALSLLRALVPLARAAGVPLFANDRPDLALLAGCDGVHVGQGDLPVSAVQQIAPGLMVGVSTHDRAQLTEALAAGPTYVALGPIYPTASKLRPDPVVGEAELGWAVAEAGRPGQAGAGQGGAGPGAPGGGRGRCPVVAIGGIDLERAPAVARAGAIGAVIGALIPEGNPSLGGVTERVRSLSRALGGT
jgi:thiamine-phosphate pyrophosphorylase